MSEVDPAGHREAMKNIGLALALVGVIAVETAWFGHRWRFNRQDADAFDTSNFASAPGFIPWSEMYRSQRDEPDDDKRYRFPDGQRWHDVRNALRRECLQAGHAAMNELFGYRVLTREEWVLALNPPEWTWVQTDVPPMECLGIFSAYVRQGGLHYAEDIQGTPDLHVINHLRHSVANGDPYPWVSKALAEAILSRESFHGDCIKGWAVGAVDEAAAYLSGGPAKVQELWAQRD